MAERLAAINAYLIAGGKYHDFDFARLELLKLLAEHERVRVRVGADYSDIDAIGGADLLITYTCDVVPSGNEIDGLRRFFARGKRWFALHGTNSLMTFVDKDHVDCPPLEPEFLSMLGSQFKAHPPIGRFKVTVKQPDHPLVAGIGNFIVEDEHYLQDYLPGNDPLLVTTFGGRTETFTKSEWTDQEHMAMYLRQHGAGEILYLALGHCRGRFDLKPLADFYPFVERGAWQLPVYYELLRRGIRWALQSNAKPA
jgi:type 1 glutamine amidotransferase